MPKAEFEFPGSHKGEAPLHVTVEERDRKGIVRVEASQDGTTAFIELSVKDWVTVVCAILVAATEKKP